VTRGRQVVRARTENWSQIQQYSLWPEQVEYELIRQCVLFNESADQRARETGIPALTISRRVKRFREEGMLSLFDQEPARTPDPERSLPDEMRQLIVNLRAEVPTMSLREMTQVCFMRFGRQPGHHSVQRALASGLTPTITTRRYPPYMEISDPKQRRKAVVELHSEGWSVTSISTYLQTPRQVIYRVLKRWITEGEEGLVEHSRAPRNPARKVTFEAITQVRRIAVATPDLGEYRVRARLEQLGIHLSQATCGRLLALNRRLYGLSTEKEKEAPKPRKEMPYKSRFRHEWWSVDIRYIEHHGITGIDGYIYQISILENYSRAVLASKLSKTQTQWDYLQVLFEALSTAGVPKGIGSSGGGQFYSTQAMSAYQMLGIHKERIEHKQAWQNYIESMFNVSRRMCDSLYACVTSWSEALNIHREWMYNYNYQRHHAHEKRDDGCHTPLQVLDWHKGQMYPPAVLDRILFATRYTRHLDRHGYVRLHKWRFCGEAGLARQPVTVWIYDGQLKIEYEATTLAEYQVNLEAKHHHVEQVRGGHIIKTPFRSPQLSLFNLEDGWLLYLPARERAPYHHRPRNPENIEQLPLPDFLGTENVEPLRPEQPTRPDLRIVDSGSA
jgi:transposase